MEKKEYAVAALLYIQHAGFVILKNTKRKRYFRPEDRTFHGSAEGFKSSTNPIAAEVTQGSVLRPNGRTINHHEAYKYLGYLDRKRTFATLKIFWKRS